MCLVAHTTLHVHNAMVTLNMHDYNDNEPNKSLSSVIFPLLIAILPLYLPPPFCCLSRYPSLSCRNISLAIPRHLAAIFPAIPHLSSISPAILRHVSSIFPVVPPLCRYLSRPP